LSVPATPGPPRRLTGGDYVALAGLLLAAGFVLALLLTGPLKVGLWRDDAVYLATAKSLADGHEYRNPQLPGAPYQTKYPILYPLVVSLVWRLWPAFPANVHVVQVVNVLLWTLGSWLAYVLMRRLWGIPRWLAACAVILAFIGPSTVPLLQAAMSEPLYLCLSMGALLALVPRDERPAESSVGGGRSDRAPQGDGKGGSGAAPSFLRSEGGLAILAGALAGAAYLTRSVGLALAVALLGDLLLRRRWRAAVLCGGLAGLSIGAWRVWCAQAAAVNSRDPLNHLLAYNLDYGSWLQASVHNLLRVVYQNTSDVALSLSLVLDPFFAPDWMDRALNGGPVAACVLYVLLIATAGLTLLGAVITWQRRRAGVHLYLVCYLGLVWIWPMSPWRFLLPILPFLTAFMLGGFYACVAWGVGGVACVLGGGPGPVPRRAEVVRPAVWGLGTAARKLALVAVLVFAVALGIRSLMNNAAPSFRWSGERLDRADAELAELVRTRTPPDAVVCGNSGGCLYLRTGRRFVPFMAYADPIPFRYPADRRFGMCGRDTTEDQDQAFARVVFTELRGYLRATHSTYLIVAVGDKRYFDRFRAAEAQHFAEVGVAGPYTLYQVIAP
jgi:hypothetical protein